LERLFLEKCIGQVGMGENHGVVVLVVLVLVLVLVVVLVVVVVVVVMSNYALHL